MPPTLITVSLVIIFIVGMLILDSSGKWTIGEIVGAVLMLAAVGTFIAVAVFGIGHQA